MKPGLTSPLSRRLRHLPWLLALALAGCAGGPPPADWKLNTQNHLASHARHFLDGDTRLADLNLEKARAQAARTARPDILARVELIGCAARSAALDWDGCPRFQALAAQASPEELAYARFLAGDWQAADADRLPRPYRDLANASQPPARLAALASIQDPLSRLIAAASLLRQGELQEDGVALAVETASERGWLRPLLAWLGLHAKLAQAAGDTAKLDALNKRIELAHQAKPRAD